MLLLLTSGRLEKCALGTLCSIGQTLLHKQIDYHNGVMEHFQHLSLINHLRTTLNLKFYSTMDTHKTCHLLELVTTQVMIAGQLEFIQKLNL